MNYLSDLGLSAEPVTAIFILCIAWVVVLSALLLTFFVLNATGIFEMSVSSHLKNPWYSFVPFFSSFAFGRLAEQYTGKKGKHCNGLGITLLALSIASFVMMMISCAALGTATIKVIFSADAALAADATLSASDFLPLLQSVIPVALWVIVAIAYKIVLLVCAYRIFAIFDFKNATAFTILSLLFNFLLPVFVFVSRKKAPVFSYAERYEQFSNFNFGA